MAFRNQHGAHVAGRPNAWFALTPEQREAAKRARRANRQEHERWGGTPMQSSLAARRLRTDGEVASRNLDFLDALADDDFNELHTFLSRRGIHR